MIAASQTDAVPDLYLEDLGSVTHELVALIPACEPPPEDDEGEDGKGKDEGEDGKDKKKDKDKDKGKDKDDE